MRFLLLMTVAVSLLAGCSHTKPKQNAQSPSSTTSNKTSPGSIIPVDLPAGKVVSVNAQLRFVVVDFGMGRPPVLEQKFAIYHQGQKVGEVKVSQQSRSNLFAADITAGDAATGDEVKMMP